MSTGPATADGSLRRPGRPRSAHARRAILAATLELLTEQGYDGMSIEAVAARAEVGKATIYRRWPSKEALVSEALGTIITKVELPGSGDTRRDLVSLLQEFQQAAAGPQVPSLFRQVIGSAVANPRFMEILRRNHVEVRRAAIRAILERGQLRGELRPDADLDLAVDLLTGLVVFRMLFDRMDPETFRRFPTEAIAALWDGIGA